MSSPEPPQQKRDIDEPPPLSTLGVLVVSLLSAGVFLWIWMVMQAMWVRKLNPESKVSALAWVSVVPAALFYINVPSLLLAMRANDQDEIMRLHIAMVMWGTIAAVFLIATFVWVESAKRQLKKR